MRLPLPSLTRLLCLLLLIDLDVDSGLCQTYAASPPAAGYADPRIHPYADTKRGRGAYRFSKVAKLQHRLYDFYSRQAEFYRSSDQVPSILPAFPGLDGGQFGHWGKNSEMGRLDGRWDRMDIGPSLACTLQIGNHTVKKALALRLGAKSGLHIAFDTEQATYRAFWTGGFLQFSESRWGLMGYPQTAGSILASCFNKNTSNQEIHYSGYFINDHNIIIDYSINKQRLLELPSTESNIDSHRFTRIIEFPNGAEYIYIPIIDTSPDFELDQSQSEQTKTTIRVRSNHETNINIEISGSQISPRYHLENKDNLLALFVSEASEASVLSIELTMSSEDKDLAFQEVLPSEFPLPSELIRGGKPRWPLTIPMPGNLGNSKNAYVVDSLGVPLGNPYQSPMFLSGLDFFKNGEAAISTFFGDVWIVSNIDQGLKNLNWKRFASGLHQPLGLEIIDGTIYTIGRDQITALHDLNKDKEADFYENIFNGFETFTGSHDYNTGLQSDDKRNLYFASAKGGVRQYSLLDGATHVLADQIRNPNGIGVSPTGKVLTSAQEGEWTPASMIIDASSGGSYGWSLESDSHEPTPPLAYIPRGVDNSSGGQTYVSSEKWGPFSGSFIGLSYGDCSHYLILESEDRHGAIIPLEGEFLSGIHRARFHPIDGQLYTIGTQGWGTYAQYDGSFERVRYLGRETGKPISFRVFENGVRLDFATPISFEGSNITPKNFFCQQWNYRYSSGYGSPEYSIQNPKIIGHDPIEIQSIHILENGSSLFIEMTDLQAAMQTHLHYAFEDERPNPLSGDLFITALDLENTFQLDGQSMAKSKTLNISEFVTKTSIRKENSSRDPNARTIILKALPGLKYDKNSITVSAGERITLRFENADAMPHNWILGRSGSYNRIGALADSELADPAFSENGYVSKSDDIIAAIPTVNPKGQSETTFYAPNQPGTYPFLCTYPGHWKIMKGTLIVY
ncbi:Copper binding protein, plastocyanin/azurin family [Verrucomicrobiia bacterium DG1235]|nr:Copper binding protein, plastocyanin/azurin family [Verrucomicrobiae bacterium DG1235]